MKIAAAALILAASSANAFTAPRVVNARTTTSLSVSQADLDGAQGMIDDILKAKNCGPVFVRLAWHDSGTHDCNIKEDFPTSGGAIGSIRFDPEINHGANAGLAGAVKLLEPVKEKYSGVSYADIFQMASARGIELAGGPKIDMNQSDNMRTCSAPINILREHSSGGDTVRVASLNRVAFFEESQIL